MVLGNCPDGYLILIYSDMEPVWMVACTFSGRMYSDCLGAIGRVLITVNSR